MIDKQTNRRLLPIVALIASALIFLAAVAFMLRSTGAAPAPTTIAGGNTTPTAIAIAIPTAAATATATTGTTPTVTAATVTATASVPSGQATATRAATNAAASTNAVVVPTAVGGGLLVTPTAAAPAPPVATSPPTQPPVAQPTATRTPTTAPVVQPPVAPTPTPTPPPPPPTATRAVAPPVAGPPPSNVGVPVRVRIPSIGVDAAVEQVGVDADGNMATPDDPWNTAWYAPGARPGQKGNAAIAGHVDYAGLGQVVFWDLDKLGPGDEVFVDTAGGATLRFVVRDSVYYRPENAPLQDIFGQTSAVNLNLITCGGTFNPVTRQYDQRLVVFTTYSGQ